jgi:hypothetical protein
MKHARMPKAIALGNVAFDLPILSIVAPFCETQFFANKCNFL